MNIAFNNLSLVSLSLSLNQVIRQGCTSSALAYPWQAVALPNSMYIVDAS